MARKAARKTAGRNAKANQPVGSKRQVKTKVKAKAKAKAKTVAKAPAQPRPAKPAAPDQKPPANPVLIEVTRGEMVESRHRVAVAVVDAGGKLVESWGDIERPIYGRSAIKPFQALPLLETGAADNFALGEPEIALACASHNGEPFGTGSHGSAARWPISNAARICPITSRPCCS
jgi:hypothetical protein